MPHAQAFSVIAGREAKSCHLCIWAARVWGLKFCVQHQGKAGDKMTRCQDYRKERNRDAEQ